jgi:hypothetical protein
MAWCLGWGEGGKKEITLLPELPGPGQEKTGSINARIKNNPGISLDKFKTRLCGGWGPQLTIFGYCEIITELGRDGLFGIESPFFK